MLLIVFYLLAFNLLYSNDGLTAINTYQFHTFIEEKKQSFNQNDRFNLLYSKNLVKIDDTFIIKDIVDSKTFNKHIVLKQTHNSIEIFGRFARYHFNKNSSCYRNY